jgi:hypothetical protein
MIGRRSVWHFICHNVKVAIAILLGFKIGKIYTYQIFRYLEKYHVNRCATYSPTLLREILLLHCE